MLCKRWNSLTPLGKAVVSYIAVVAALGIAIILYGRYAHY